MRLVAESDAKTLEKDPKAEVPTFYVEKCKNNSIPKHFFADENKDKKKIKINGQEVTVARNVERSQYVAFCTGDEETKECFYIRDHKFLDHAKSYVTYVKPKPEPKPKKEKAPKAEAAEGGEAKGNGKKGKSSAASEKAKNDAKAATAGAEGDTGAA